MFRRQKIKIQNLELVTKGKVPHIQSRVIHPDSKCLLQYIVPSSSDAPLHQNPEVEVSHFKHDTQLRTWWNRVAVTLRSKNASTYK